MTITHFAADQGTDFINPERGFVTPQGAGYDFSLAALQVYKDKGISVIWFEPVIDSYIDAPFGQDYLDYFQTVMDKFRAARMKTIIRFRYSITSIVDATLTRILGHLTQLQPYLMAINYRTIATKPDNGGEPGFFKSIT